MSGSPEQFTCLTPALFGSGVDNDGDGKTDCNDTECKSEDVCVFAGLNPKCSRNKGCSSLTGLW